MRVWIDGQTLSEGAAEGELVLLDEPLSLWGGMDLDTGTIIDRHHPQCGTSIVGRILAMRSGRGSSSSTSVLTEAIRIGTAPAGIVLAERDIIIALGAIAAEILYEIRCPVVRIGAEAFDRLRPARVRLTAAPEGASLEIPAA